MANLHINPFVSLSANSLWMYMGRKRIAVTRKHLWSHCPSRHTLTLVCDSLYLKTSAHKRKTLKVKKNKRHSEKHCPYSLEQVNFKAHVSPGWSFQKMRTHLKPKVPLHSWNSFSRLQLRQGSHGLYIWDLIDIYYCSVQCKCYFQNQGTARVSGVNFRSQ